MKKFLVLDQCSWAILDEADKMIDMGFEGDVNFILDSITTILKSTNDTVAEQQERLARTGQE
jgi:ATP-dependent RNA helicase DDX23/PRP28